MISYQKLENNKLWNEKPYVQTAEQCSKLTSLINFDRVGW